MNALTLNQAIVLTLIRETVVARGIPPDPPAGVWRHVAAGGLA